MSMPVLYSEHALHISRNIIIRGAVVFCVLFSLFSFDLVSVVLFDGHGTFDVRTNLGACRAPEGEDGEGGGQAQTSPY